MIDMLCELAPEADARIECRVDIEAFGKRGIASLRGI